jgi:hypothetical protein
MSARRAIALTDSQLAIVIDAANALPASWRSRFLEAIADQLLPSEQVTNAELKRAIDTVLRRIGVAA